MSNPNVNKNAFFSLKLFLSNVIASIVIISVGSAAAIVLYFYHVIFYTKACMNYYYAALLITLLTVFLHFAYVGVKGLGRGWFDN